MSGDDPRHRLGLLAVAALSLFGALVARLWFLQIVEGPTLEARANRNATRTVVIPAPRGRILDKNGVVLVDNRESLVVTVDWQAYSDLPLGDQTRLLRRLAKDLNAVGGNGSEVTAKAMRLRIGDTRFSHFRPIPVLEDISEDQAAYLREEAARFPTVEVERQTVRSYPYGSLAAHVLGYVGPLTDAQWQVLSKRNDAAKPYVQTDEIGRSGVEVTFEKYLRGTPGRRVYEVDRRNRVVGELRSRRIEPKPGDDVYLSLDARVQAEAEHSLRLGLSERRRTTGKLGYYGAEAAATAIVDPHDGEVVAMASYPTYDPSKLVGGISCPEWRDLQGLPREGSCRTIDKEIKAMPVSERPLSKLQNRAMQGLYPPGSTFKLATSLAAMKLGLLSPSTSLYDPGYYLVPGCKGDRCRVSSPSAESGGIGTVNLSQAITASSDTYFYKLGNDIWALYKSKGKVGPTAFQDEVAKLGFGRPTGIDLPGEASGRLPDPEWLKKFDIALNGKPTDAGRWTAGSSINLAIGQGDMLATPLQLANAYAAFANDGTLYQPTVVDRVTRSRHPNQVVYRHRPKVVDRVDWGADNHAALLDGFEGVTQNRPHATARVAFQGFPQDTWPAAGKTGTAQSGDRTHPRPDHSWFVGFGPNPDTRYVAAMVMEHAGFGGDASAPAVRRILEAIARQQLDDIDLASLASPDAIGVIRSTAGGDGTNPDGTSSSTTTQPGTAGTGTGGQDGGTMAPVPGGTG